MRMPRAFGDVRTIKALLEGAETEARSAGAREAIATQHTAALRAVGIDVSDSLTAGVATETAPAPSGVYHAGALRTKR
ncbi:hypothetical protein [Frankia sp. QA3]|uniref:hypothetical protein n=1 Tax=Frankia sp. QA3 TaxID=710111 RepID=UPI000269C4E8|nr:hypothetical protein [Frankia sp. QA3]EIV93904.1 hypothetical protein FraQA3DRAFT_3625 [Frankia sp. QA3]